MPLIFVIHYSYILFVLFYPRITFVRNLQYPKIKILTLGGPTLHLLKNGRMYKKAPQSRNLSQSYLLIQKDPNSPKKGKKYMNFVQRASRRLFHKSQFAKASLATWRQQCFNLFYQNLNAFPSLRQKRMLNRCPVNKKIPP